MGVFPAVPGIAVPGALSPGVPAAPAGVFPAGVVDARVDLYLGYWSDITRYVYGERQKLAITRGRAPESTTAQPQTLHLQANNRDARFSPHNPAGPYWGLIGRNTPVRVSVPAQETFLRLEDDAISSCSTPGTTALNLAGDLDARIDLRLTSWASAVLAAKYTSSGTANASWSWGLNADGTLFFQWYNTGGSFSSATSTQPLPWPGGRFSLRVTLAQASGTVTFYYATSIGGSWTQLGSALTGSTGALRASTSALAVGYNAAYAGQTGYAATLYGAPGTAWKPLADLSLQGRVYEFALRAGIGGSLVADPQFSAAADGATSLADAQGNTWTCSGSAAVSARDYRFHGEISEWPPKWDESGTDVYTDIAASGQLRRLQQKAPPIGSAMTRGWLRKTGTYAPVAYWPAEDGNNSQVVTLGLLTVSSSNPAQIASGLAGGAAMQLSGNGKTQFASSSAFASSSPLPVPNGDIWTGTIPRYATTTTQANVVRFLMSVASGGETDQAVIMRLYTTGTIRQLDLVYDAGFSGGFHLVGYGSSGSQVFAGSADALAPVNGTNQCFEFALTVSGGTVTWHLNALKTGAATQFGVSGTFSGSVGRMTRVVVNPGAAAITSGIGQIGVQTAWDVMDSATSADSIIGPLNAWVNETAGLRFARLCSEQGYPFRVVGYPSTSVVMGPQTSQSFMNLLQECEAADRGLIFESRGSLGLAYRTSGSLAAQAYAFTGSQPLALSYTAAQLGGGNHMTIDPVDDDQLTVNDMLVTRGGGSVTGSTWEAVATADQYSATAALSISSPPAGAGLYQDSATVNVSSDVQLGDQAAWSVHLGTVNEMRFPSVPADLARTELATLVASLQAVDVGDYLQVTSPPAWLQPDTVKALAWGYTETIGGFIWTVSYVTRPESPFEVLVAGTGALSDCRADADASTLTAGISAGAATFQVSTAAGSSVWTTAAADFPVDILIGGERMTVSGITGTTSPQTFTVTRAVNGISKAHLAAEPVNLFQPCYAALV